MPDEARPEEQEQYELVFKNGALGNLKELAKVFGIPETELRQVVRKAIALLNLTKDAKTLVMEDKKGDRFKIDVKSL